jgi:hypothetical protein
MNVSVPELDRATRLMRGFEGPWGVAGGWAIDLFVGSVSRPHADVDVAILRNDQRALRRRLEGARTSKVIAGTLTPWSAGEELVSPIHEVHATWPDGYHLEFLLNEQDRGTAEWVFRRDTRIRRALGAAFRRDRDMPYLAPEIVLLYKSKAPTRKDDDDLAAARAALDSEQRDWLVQALAVTAPNHPWAAKL